MMNEIHIEAQERLSTICRSTDFNALSLSAHHREYLDTLLRNLDYFTAIYSKCISVIDSSTPLNDIVCVDYGGGCGLFSIYAKLLGIGKVIYVDISPLSVEAAKGVFKSTGLSADVLLHGDVLALKQWCATNGVTPTHLISTDVIEHIYDLDGFFNTLREINPALQMVFTTASVANNPFKSHMLHQEMRRCESEYLTLRLKYIQNKFPSLDASKAAAFARDTRGLIYSDIDAVVLGEANPPQIDKYNTCDPETGNFIERILTLGQYRQMVKPSSVTFHNGFYNVRQKSAAKRAATKLLNNIIEKCPVIGKMVSPFIIIQISLLSL